METFGFAAGIRPTDMAQDESADRRTGDSPDTAAGVLARIPATVLLERMPFPAVAVDARGQIVLTNDALIALLGHTRDHLTGRPIHVLAPGLLSSKGDVIAQLNGWAHRIVVLTDASGENRYARISASLLLRHDEDFAVVLFEDVTEQRWQGHLPSGRPTAG